MEEIIIKSKLDNKKRTQLLTIAIGAIVVAAMLFGLTYLMYTSEDNWYTGTSYSNVTLYGELYRIPYTYTRCYNEYHEFFTFYLADFLCFVSMVTWVVFAAMIKSELTVTSVRVSGKTKFGKVVDLPVDMISAVSISKANSGIAVSTASGVNQFFLLENYEDIYHVINNLISQRQKEQVAPAPAAPVVDSASELLKYKDLLDQGIITQEEFDAKKKQLLGL